MEQENTKWSERLKISKEKLPNEIKFWKIQFVNIQIHMEGLNTILSSIDPELFINKIREKIPGLTYDKDTTYNRSGINISNLQLKELFEACSLGSLEIYFSKGNLLINREGEDEIVNLKTLIFIGETMQITLNGDREILEEAMNRVLSTLFECVGVKLNWAKIKQRIFVSSWKTGVKVDLNINLIDLLNPNLKKLLEYNFPNFDTDNLNENLAVHHFGDQNFINGYGGKINKRERFALFDPEINFHINLVEKNSGFYTPVDLQFTRERKVDRGSSMIYVIATTDPETLKGLLVQLKEVYGGKLG